MKKNIFKYVFAALTAFVITFATPASAGEDAVCTVTFTTGAAGNTTTAASGTCTWGVGAIILMQCDASVYWSTLPVSGGAPVATSSHLQVNFVANSDPYIIYLDRDRRHISVLGVSASGTCKFAPTTMRKKPV